MRRSLGSRRRKASKEVKVKAKILKFRLFDFFMLFFGLLLLFEY